ncbi:MAG: molecular chaperone TorD family protein [Candidatus Zixiibacteriota bacterium]|nr:MAG: molecular chaperone TorD family protein [candidate division Zixibacteria bacterium]
MITRYPDKTVMDKEDFIHSEHARASVFNVFTALFCQPEEDLIRNDQVFDTLKLALDDVNPDCSKIVGRMQKAVKQSTAQELLIEYTRLFIGPFKTLVPPYSSLYFGSETLMSDQTVWVVDFYKKAGLTFDRETKEVPDHIAIETEFMYWLIHNEIKALDSGDRDRAFSLWENQKEFFTKHYGKWAPEFCARISTETENEYFRLLSECFGKFITDVEIPEFPD